MNASKATSKCYSLLLLKSLLEGALELLDAKGWGRDSKPCLVNGGLLSLAKLLCNQMLATPHLSQTIISIDLTLRGGILGTVQNPEKLIHESITIPLLPTLPGPGPDLCVGIILLSGIDVLNEFPHVRSRIELDTAELASLEGSVYLFALRVRGDLCCECTDELNNIGTPNIFGEASHRVATVLTTIPVTVTE